MAGHRSPRGRHPHGGPVATRHLTACRPAPAGPSLRTSVLATAAALGAVATGALTSLVPALGDGATTTADATEGPVNAVLAANTTRLAAVPALGAMYLPVSLALAGGTDDDATADPYVALLTKADKAAGLAVEIAQLHAKEQSRQRDQAQIGTLIERGGLDGWIAEALRILELPQSLAQSVKRIILAESGGNPRAINTWDANAERGTPSQGLMQTIPSTYRHYVHPDLADRPITDPVANITAGIRYMIATYGVDTLEAGGRSNARGTYVGY